jgi:tRNA-specific 2-thiouridylase
VGQRRGLGIASPKPLYVLKIDSENNRIVVGDKKNLLSIGLIATELNLIGIEKLNHSYEVKTKIRLKHKECDATLFPHEKDKAKILFTEPQKSVAPGQSVVFYKNDIVMGGGIIEQAL